MCLPLNFHALFIKCEYITLHFKLPWWEFKQNIFKYSNPWPNFEKNQLVPNSHHEMAVLDRALWVMVPWRVLKPMLICTLLDTITFSFVLAFMFYVTFQMTVFSFSAQIKVNSFFKCRCVWSTINSEVFNASFWFVLLKKHEEIPTLFTDNKHCPAH